MLKYGKTQLAGEFTNTERGHVLRQHWTHLNALFVFITHMCKQGLRQLEVMGFHLMSCMSLNVLYTLKHVYMS